VQVTPEKPQINKIRQGVLDRSMPSAVANSGAKSNIGTKKNTAKQACIPTGKTEQEHQQATYASSTTSSTNQHKMST
jgi:hypothetical protein